MKKIDKILFSIKFSIIIFCSIYIVVSLFKIHQDNQYLESIYAKPSINYLPVKYTSVNSYSVITD